MANSIIAGNDFRLIIRAKKSTGAYLADMDLADVEDLRIYLTRAGRSKVLQSYTLDDEGHAVIYVSAGVVTNATYGIEMVGVYGGARLRAHNTSVFTISGHGGGNSGVLNDYYADIVFVINVAATDVYVQNAIEAHNEDEASHPHLLQLIEEAGDVDDVQIDGESIVDENKIAKIDSSLFGKVDDVKVNGTSVVSNKKAEITIPEKVSDLPNDADYATKQEAQQMVDDAKIDTVSVDYQEDGGAPDVSASFEDGELALSLKNMKMKFSDLTAADKAEIKGEKGDQGDSAVYDPSSPDAPDFVMANTTGQSTTKAMTQKAVTDELTVFTPYNVDLSSYTQKRAFPTPDKWMTDSPSNPFYGKFVPVTPGNKYYLKANSNAAFNYAFLTTDAYSKGADVSYATGCTREKVDADDSVTVQAPSDAHYLYILTQTAANTTPETVTEYVAEEYKEYFKALSQPFKCRWFGAIGTVGATEFPLEIDTAANKVRVNTNVRISGGNSLTSMITVAYNTETDFVGEYQEGVNDGYTYALLVAYNKPIGAGHTTTDIYIVRYDEYEGFFETYSDYNIIELGRGVLRNKGKEFVAFGNIIIDGEKHYANPPKIDYGMLSYTSVIGGYLNNNGTITANNTGRGVTEFIPVSKGMAITITSNGVGIYAASGTYVAYYDTDFSFVSADTVPLPSAASPLLNDFAFIVPDSSSIAYMRLTIANNANPILLNSDDFMTTVQRSCSSAYNVKNTNKSIGVFGGSFSVIAESNYAKKYWKEYLKCSVTNYGEGGAGYSSLQKGLQGHSIQDQVDNAGVHDIYVLWASTNDFTNSREIGAYSDYTAVDNYDESKLVTQCGGINYCIKKLFEKNPNAEIYLFTSLRFFTRDAGYNPFSTDFNSLNKNFADYIKGQKECCEYYGIPVLDMFNYQGVNIFNYTQYYQNDHLHMNAAGYEKIGRMQAQFLANGK